jgi:hypothetical protein
MSPRTAGHEVSDAPPALVVGAIATLLSLVVIGALVAWGVTAAVRSKAPPVRPSPFDRAAASPAFPRLEVNSRADRILLDDRAQGRLTGYGWADPQHTLARVPIERAMALQAARGWPDSDAPASSAPAQRRPAP